jgi:glycosyltransferase involved in cell wall biosynthesis
MLKAFSLVVNRYPDCWLQLIGDGDLQDKMKTYGEELGHRGKVSFLGNQSDVYPFLQKADLFLMPSKFEGMPMTIIEAMGTGLPVVASAVGGVPDMMVNRESGMLVSCEPEAVASAVCELLDSEELRKTLGTNARLRSEQFGSEYMARRYLEAYIL